MKRILLLALLLAGCVQLPPSPADIQAKRFEPVADKAVIYVVRPPVDSLNPGVLSLDVATSIPTFGGTFHRLEVAPGLHHIDGAVPTSPRLTLNAERGKIYFLRYAVRGDRGPVSATLQQVGEKEGRELVMQAQLYP
jgi:hypothetical protein